MLQHFSSLHGCTFGNQQHVSFTLNLFLDPFLLSASPHGDFYISFFQQIFFVFVNMPFRVKWTPNVADV